MAESGRCGDPDKRHHGPPPSRLLPLRWHRAQGPPSTLPHRGLGGRGNLTHGAVDGVPQNQRFSSVSEQQLPSRPEVADESNKVIGDAAAGGPRSTLGEPLP